MTRKEFLQHYWCYYLVLEEKFRNTLNYVELDQDNERTFSNEYALLLQAIGAELDNFFKVYCRFSPDDRKTIKDYCPFVLNRYSDIVNQKVFVLGYDYLNFVSYLLLQMYSHQIYVQKSMICTSQEKRFQRL